MIQPNQFKARVIRFEKAVHTRALASTVGGLDHAITFEYRQAKRELLALGHLLITGENPDNAMELSVQRRTDGMVSSGEPKTSANEKR